MVKNGNVDKCGDLVNGDIMCYLWSLFGKCGLCIYFAD